MTSSFGNAFVQAIRSESVTLFVGSNEDAVQLSKPLVSKTSNYLAKLIEENHGMLLSARQ